MSNLTTPERLARLIESPRAQKMLAELDQDAEREFDAQRTAGVARIREARTRSEREVPKLRVRTDQARQAVLDADRALLAAQHAYGEAASAQANEGYASNSVIGKEEEALRSSAPEEALEFMRWTWTEFDRVRSSGVADLAASTGNPELGQLRRRSYFTNLPSLTAYVAELKAAREDVLRLIVTEPSRARIRQLVEELRQSLPTVHEELVHQG